MNEAQVLMRTILFADVSGSTRLFHTLGDSAAQTIISVLLDKLAGVVLRWQGEIVKTIGDELMCAFPDPESAARAAQDMQLLTHEHRGNAPLSLRVGFHYGSVLADQNDYFGDTVNLAARVTSVATIDRILTTAETRDNFSRALAVSGCRFVGPRIFKGIDTPVEVYEIFWRTGISTGVAPAQFTTDHFEFAYRRLSLVCRGYEYAVDRASGPLTIGREPDNRLAIIDDICVSSHHASIELWGGQFVLLDTSHNGTHACFDGEQSFKVSKELRLRKSGTLWFGRWPRDPKVVFATFVSE